LSAPATANTTTGDAQYTTRTYQKLTADATSQGVDVPARYENRSYQKVATPASTRSIDVPAEYRTVTRRQLVKAGGFTEWREVVCEADQTPQ